ncbi:tyrosine-type recombinase/integrase [Sphingobium subterraneum]|uniref:Integrase n=1 Tax=Sphingobium subterraneum TaxID=627688 RepID=A0A841IWE2_9SPHN|nr:integrase [Sphingobium subterraneum]
MEAGIEWEIGKIAEEYEGQDDLPDVEEYRLAALHDARSTVQGLPVPIRKSMQAPFRELADDYMVTWRTKHGLKATNTEQQMLATFDLFAGFFGKKPIRDVRDPDAAHFVDALRQLHPNWARKPKAREMPWRELMKAYGGQPKGLADATVNRHMATLKTFWKWAKRRGHCDGENPFEGHHRTLKEGINAQGYVAWTEDELTKLFSPPPKRADLTELMLVALYSGMRLDEIASLTVADIQRKPVPFIRVTDAKTRAGNRDVPIHPALWWLVDKATGEGGNRLWPSFRDEGPGGKPGGDAGKEFSRHKAGKGYRDRVKAFHSFRKNFVGQLERRRVPEQEVAQIVGHEKAGFTFGTYGGEAELRRKAKVVSLIAYPNLPIPDEYRIKEPCKPT